MRIGVISEGHADRAVIVNIIEGLTGLDSSDIEALRPIYNMDETDKAVVDPRTFSSWSVVKSECESRELIDGFLAFEGQDFVVIHIDAAEAHEYGVERPNRKSPTYCEDLRALIISTINNDWLQEDLSASLLYAIAIEEIDAWILTMHETGDTSTFLDAKGRLSRTLRRKSINSTSDYDNYLKLSGVFAKPRTYMKEPYLNRNCSLAAFCQEVIDKVKPQIAVNKE